MQNDGAPRDDLVARIERDLMDEAALLNSPVGSVDLEFLAYLRLCSRFGFFSFGPVTIDVRLVEDIVKRTAPRRAPGDDSPITMSDDLVRFSRRLMDEVRRGGQRRIDELHFLLAFMRTDEGVPQKVFSELGVTAEQVEEFARNGAGRADRLERLYSPEQAAAYLNVHVQTVRAWIRSGRLPALRLAGQRALRIKASDLLLVLEPVSPGDAD